MGIPEMRSPLTGSTLLERLSVALLALASVGFWLGIVWAGRAIVAALS